MLENVQFSLLCFLCSLFCVSSQNTGVYYPLNWLNCYRMSKDDCTDVAFWYFSKNTFNTPGIQVDSTQTPSSLGIVAGASWKIVFHGFLRSKDLTPNVELKKAYFSRGEYNYLSGDASKPIGGVGKICYPVAVSNLVKIGNCFGQKLADLITRGILPGADQLHFIGHSLGAHIAGIAANKLLELKGKKVVRITGLDPAAPLLDLDNTPAYKILQRDDAQFVDIHHTSGGYFLAKGQIKEMGTVDIYYNGGKRQPKCITKEGCSHLKVSEYYAESVSPETPLYNEFYGYNEVSNTTVKVGEHMPLNSVGVFQVEVNPKFPFARGFPDTTTKGRKSVDNEKTPCCL